jgi:hypothetical protein
LIRFWEVVGGVKAQWAILLLLGQSATPPPGPPERVPIESNRQVIPQTPPPRSEVFRTGEPPDLEITLSALEPDVTLGEPAFFRTEITTRAERASHKKSGAPDPPHYYQLRIENEWNACVAAGSPDSLGSDLTFQGWSRLDGDCPFARAATPAGTSVQLRVQLRDNQGAAHASNVVTVQVRVPNDEDQKARALARSLLVARGSGSRFEDHLAVARQFPGAKYPAVRLAFEVAQASGALNDRIQQLLALRPRLSQAKLSEELVVLANVLDRQSRTALRGTVRLLFAADLALSGNDRRARAELALADSELGELAGVGSAVDSSRAELRTILSNERR